MAIIICTRQRTKKRTGETLEELWAIAGVLQLWKSCVLAGRDDVLGSSLVQQWEPKKKLSARQWAAVVLLAKRYQKQLGEVPEPSQMDLLE